MKLNLALLLSLFFSHPALADRTDTLARFTLTGALSSQVANSNICKAKEQVQAIKLSPKGPKSSYMQIQAVQVLSTANTWETLPISGSIPADQDTAWMPLQISTPRCIKQVLVYGKGLGMNINLEVRANITAVK